MHPAPSTWTPSLWSWHARRSIRPMGPIAGASMWPPRMSITWWRATRTRATCAPRCTRIIWTVRARRSSPYPISLGWNVETRSARCRSLRSALAPLKSLVLTRSWSVVRVRPSPPRLAPLHACVCVCNCMCVLVCVCSSVCVCVCRYIQHCYLLYYRLCIHEYICIYLYIYTCII